MTIDHTEINIDDGAQCFLIMFAAQYTNEPFPVSHHELLRKYKCGASLYTYKRSAVDAIIRYGKEDVDYTIKENRNSKTNRTSPHYFMTLDFFKSLCAASHNPVGAEIRRYLIEAEKLLLHTLSLQTTIPEAMVQRSRALDNMVSTIDSLVPCVAPEIVVRDNLARTFPFSQVELKCRGGRIDILTEHEIIEVKSAADWKHALGQILVYGASYPEHQKRIHLFGIVDDREFIERVCTQLGVKVTYD